MVKSLMRFLSDESGAASVEYALVVSVVAASVAGGSGQFGGTFGAVMDDVALQVEMYLD